MKRANKKGFTIVELVIVVAVVAVLAAVLIPTFSEVVEKAQMAKDIALYRNIQTIIQAERMLGSDISDSEKAMEVLQKNGIEEIVTYSNTYSISWDNDSSNFILISSDDNIIPDGEQSDDIEVKPNDSEDNESAKETFTVTYNVDSEVFDISDCEKTALPNESYTVKLIFRQSYYFITDLKIEMGDEIVTPDSFDRYGNDLEIVIELVTADIKITATTVVNQVRRSLDLSGKYTYGNTDNGYNNKQSKNGTGYINNACLSTDMNINGACVSAVETNYKSAEGFTSTGWIELPWNEYDTIEMRVYIKGGKLTLATNGNYKYYFYSDIQASKSTDDIREISTLYNQTYMMITLKKETHYWLNYFRLSLEGYGENLVVTFNEPIFQAD